MTEQTDAEWLEAEQRVFEGRVGPLYTFHKEQAQRLFGIAWRAVAAEKRVSQLEEDYRLQVKMRVAVEAKVALSGRWRQDDSEAANIIITRRNQRIVELEAQVAEMRDALKCALDYTNDGLPPELVQERYGFGDPKYTCGDIVRSRIHKALSFDAGEGWVSPEKVQRLREVLEYIVNEAKAHPGIGWLGTIARKAQEE